MVVEYGFVDVLMSLIYDFCWFCWYNAYSTCFSCLCFIFMHCTMFLCCVVHTMFLIKCFLDVFVCVFEFHGIQICRDNYVSLILKHHMIMCFYTLP